MKFNEDSIKSKKRKKKVYVVEFVWKMCGLHQVPVGLIPCCFPGMLQKSEILLKRNAVA